MAPLMWWAVSAMLRPGESMTARMVTWPTRPPDDAAAMWTAGVLFLSGVTAYVVRGGRQ
ncbi:hypothetical protein [Lentzea nigeriaca]|uniref:hypothetical protein n=1 Tax=Lentzea nigeriaca TaxID=1128665 RepID=UPI001956755C|nr:hypothetical protein [Lentzea nigeriaca]MBM7857282.1 hypothetical protein [Lentzea nigeriaca]